MHIFCKNAQDVCELFKEAKKPLNDLLKADITEVAEDLNREKLDEGFVVVLSKCRICNYESTNICPAIVDLDNLECGNCGNMTMQEKDEPEWWQ